MAAAIGLRRRVPAILPSILAATLTAVLAACGPSAVPSADGVEPLRRGVHRGMNVEPIGGYGGPIDLDELPASLDALVHLGVDSVALIPSFFQPSLTATELTWDVSRDRVHDDTRAAIRLAHERGLRVLLKPHLWLRDRSPDTWRGDIDPDDAIWPAWREAYRDAVLGFAELGAQEGVAAISIGSELSALAESRPEFWRELAGSVRDVFPGAVTYAANWDREYAAIEWWDSLDFIGVDAFWPLQEAAGETLTQGACERRLGAIRDEIVAVSRRFERPVLVTEIGYKSAVDGAHRPWEWPEDVELAADAALQETVYRCIASVLGDTPEIAGVYFWVWYTDLAWGGSDNTDFTPRGKPAERVLAGWFRALR